MFEDEQAISNNLIVSPFLKTTATIIPYLVHQYQIKRASPQKVTPFITFSYIKNYSPVESDGLASVAVALTASGAFASVSMIYLSIFLKSSLPI